MCGEIHGTDEVVNECTHGRPVGEPKRRQCEKKS